MEWFSNFYASTQLSDDPAERPLEGICREGEIMFVPRGWWHAVVNLEDCIAVTQNYVGSHNLKETMQFLYLKRDQVSGVVDERREGLYEEFKEAFFKSNWVPSSDLESGEECQNEGSSSSQDDTEKRRHLMDMWIKNEEEIERLSKLIKRCKGEHTEGENGSTEQPLTFWEKAKLGAGDQQPDQQVGSSGSGGFSFGFDFGDEEPDEDAEADVDA